jgi:hypothetical protein
MLARTHIERDAAKVFEAVVLAMAAQQAEGAASNGGRVSGSAAGQDDVGGADGDVGDT